MKKPTKKPKTKKATAEKKCKTLIVFYSRTGTTKKVADEIKQALNSDVDEILDTKERKGVIGYLRSGRDATKKFTTDIKPSGKDPAAYDLVIVGTPIWSWNLTPPVRTYLRNNKAKLKEVAFFCTMGGSGAERAFASMEEESGKKPKATLALLTREVVDGTFTEKAKAFAASIKDGKNKD